MARKMACSVSTGLVAASSVFGACAYLTAAPEAVDHFATADDPTAADPIDAVAVPRGIIVPC